MKTQLQFLLTCAVVGAMGVGALSAEAPLSQDPEGNVWFRTPDGTVLKVGANCDVTIDGQVLINCRERRGGEVKLAIGTAEWRGGFLEVEDRFGNELEVYPTHAEAEARDGSEYELPLASSPVGGHAALEISGDWRGVETRYRAADTAGILVELGAVQEDDYLRLALGGDILFDFDSTVVRPDAAGELAKAAHVIRQRSVGEVYVVGHTDSVGGDDYNLALSRDRAAAVTGWLRGREGIPASILVGRGMGSSQPRAHNTMPDGADNPAGRAQNRRVEILLATREGIDLVNVAGLVRVDAGGIDVGGGAVRVDAGGVDVGGGAVRVDPGGVRVGGVEITAGGIKIPDVTVGTAAGVRVVSDEEPSICVGGQTCVLSCPDGDCRMTCAGGANCTFSCAGGDCVMGCAGGADCDFSCTGGDCRFDCAMGSRCRTSCLGGDCSRS